MGGWLLFMRASISPSRSGCIIGTADAWGFGGLWAGYGAAARRTGLLVLDFGREESSAGTRTPHQIRLRSLLMSRGRLFHLPGVWEWRGQNRGTKGVVLLAVMFDTS
jgi:hypothetical protein